MSNDEKDPLLRAYEFYYHARPEIKHDSAAIMAVGSLIANRLTDIESWLEQIVMDMPKDRESSEE